MLFYVKNIVRFIENIVRFIEIIVRCVYYISGTIFHRKGERSMSITATELKTNLGKYLLLAAKEDIFITRNGKVVAKLSNPYQDRVDIAKSLFGVLPADMTLEQAREDRLKEL